MAYGIDPGSKKFTVDGQVGSTGNAIRVETVHLVSTSTASAYATFHNGTAAGEELLYIATEGATLFSLSGSNQDYYDVRFSGGCYLLTGTNFNYVTITYASERR